MILSINEVVLTILKLLLPVVFPISVKFRQNYTELPIQWLI